MTSLPAGYRAAVIGASGTIGGAIADALRSDPRCGDLILFSRRPRAGERPIDLTDEASVAAAASHCGDLRLLFIASGALILNDRPPEKALSQVDPQALADQFALNAIGPLLALKHFAPQTPRKERAMIAALSARVGSIGDNRLGGWYGYRAAKTALNQYLRAASIELGRSRRELVVAALHPGTVESPLSKPFRPAGAADPGILEPDQSAARLLRVLDGLRADQSGGFWDYAGAPIPW
mgnify:CR=1 FL=1